MKEQHNFIVHGDSLESLLHNQSDYLTPTDRFFVCNSGSTPNINSQEYALRIWGQGVASPAVLSFKDLCELPTRTVPALLECAGNHRTFFRGVTDQPVQFPSGTSKLFWSTGAVGMAEWTGVSLADVLSVAGLRNNALQVCPSGSEVDSSEGRITMPLGISKALDPDTLLAFQMNGIPLPAEHGFPVRMLVPGWIGAYSVKWVQDIEVRTTPLWVRRNTQSYVLRGDLWPEAKFHPALGAPITELNIKSSLALPLPASFSTGNYTIHGFARSPGRRIKSVHWSDNQGQSWQAARLKGRNHRYGWVRFEFQWSAQTSARYLLTKATDESGQVQPDTVPFNTGGYLFNAIHPHPVSVR